MTSGLGLLMAGFSMFWGVFFSSVLYGWYIFILFYPSLQKFYIHFIVVSSDFKHSLFFNGPV